jgi:predicted dehydrogenase
MTWPRLFETDRYPRVCVVGAGGLSSLRIYPNLGPAGLRLVGVCDLDPAKAERNATLFGGTAYTELDAMLDSERPDGVVVCVGPQGHAELAIRVLQAGYPVYTEKPPALSAAAATEVARVSSETGLLCMTAFKKRYSTAFAHAHDWLRRYPSSDWISISVDYSSGGYGFVPELPWGADVENFFLFDFALHHLDLVHHLMGDVAEVFAFQKLPNAFAISLRFQCGAVGTIATNDGRGVPTEEVELTVAGGNSLTVSNSSRWREARDGEPSGWREPPTYVASGDSGFDTGHLAELCVFANHLADGAPVASPIAESLKSLVLYEAILESVRRHQSVTPDSPSL